MCVGSDVALNVRHARHQRPELVVHSRVQHHERCLVAYTVLELPHDVAARRAQVWRGVGTQVCLTPHANHRPCL